MLLSESYFAQLSESFTNLSTIPGLRLADAGAKVLLLGGKNNEGLCGGFILLSALFGICNLKINQSAQSSSFFFNFKNLIHFSCFKIFSLNLNKKLKLTYR